MDAVVEVSYRLPVNNKAVANANQLCGDVMGATTAALAGLYGASGGSVSGPSVCITLLTIMVCPIQTTRLMAEVAPVA